MSLDARIASREAMLGVVGLGYVGLPVAASFAANGFRVRGVDLDEARVAAIARGESPIGGEEPELAALVHDVVRRHALTVGVDHAELADADVILIAVDTRIDEDHRATFGALREAARAVGRFVRPGALVIVESTVAPGTCERVVAPAIAEERGLVAGRDFFLGHCPERVMPGRLLRNLRAMPRVCGASAPDIGETMRRLYAHVVRARCDVTDLATAELVKVSENAYRDVGIAFANQLARLCDAAGADFVRVRELVNLVPGRDVLLAGAGVGGHCIPEASWLLAHGAPSVPLDLLRAARAVNDDMPRYVLGLVQHVLEEHRRAVDGSRVAILGVAYREETSDARNSPTNALVSLLHAEGARTFLHDPWIDAHARPLDDVLRGCDVAVVMVAHAAYRDLDLERVRSLLRTPAIVDGRLSIDPQAARRAGLSFRGVGRSL